MNIATISDETMKVLLDVFDMMHTQGKETIEIDKTRDDAGAERFIVRDNIAGVVLWRGEEIGPMARRHQAEDKLRELRRRRIILAIIGAYNP